jgi:hypothetical protein
MIGQIPFRCDPKDINYHARAGNRQWNAARAIAEPSPTGRIAAGFLSRKNGEAFS